ncbi:hypothetical protein T265_07937 [Opisthorchis viverrini]|uniref:Uncharacterized protein n=1 Tax=Opisthorchis viverrini TaxID=6198 RepID=A0A074ZB77_OPIVI|nr:hypothetical protein T265_07937 [Opisthorchis viverrini]KER24378.1 hypothetical protein T265_07937 [Opisthorchis viverrini]
MPVTNGAPRTRQKFQKVITAYAIYTKRCTTVLEFVLGINRPCAPLNVRLTETQGLRLPDEPQIGETDRGLLADFQQPYEYVITIARSDARIQVRPTCAGRIVVPRSPRVRSSTPGTAIGYALLMSSNKSRTRIQCFPPFGGIPNGSPFTARSQVLLRPKSLFHARLAKTSECLAVRHQAEIGLVKSLDPTANHNPVLAECRLPMTHPDRVRISRKLLPPTL